jgi:hypothetical protein
MLREGKRALRKSSTWLRKAQSSFPASTYGQKEQALRNGV